MKNLDRPNEARAVRPARLLTSAVALALATGVAGIAAGPGAAATSTSEAKASAHEKKVKRPKVKHGVLKIEGTDAGESIALRLKAGDPGTGIPWTWESYAEWRDALRAHGTAGNIAALLGHSNLRV